PLFLAPQSRAIHGPSPRPQVGEGESSIPSPLQCAHETRLHSPQTLVAHRSPRLRPPAAGHAARAVPARLLAEAPAADTQRLSRFRAADPARGSGRSRLRGRRAVAADPPRRGARALAGEE